MKAKRLGCITDPEVLQELGFSECTPLQQIIEHWQRVERTYSQNIYRSEINKKESLKTYQGSDLKQTPFKKLKQVLP